MEKLRHNIHYLYNVPKKNYEYERDFCNLCSPGIRILEGTKTDEFCVPKQCERDFTTPDKGLVKGSKLSSEDMMLKIPHDHFPDNFIYDYRTQSFVFGNKQPKFNTTSKKSQITLRNSFNLACSVCLDSRLEKSKSQTDIFLKIPVGSVDSMIIETPLFLENRIVGEEVECKYLNSKYESDATKQLTNTSEFLKICNIPQGLRKVTAALSNKNFQPFCSGSHDEQSQKLEQNEHIASDQNEVSIKLRENLFLRLIADVDEQEENTCSEESNRSVGSTGLESDEFPVIKILLKNNGETIREFSPTLAAGNKVNRVIVSDMRDYKKIFCVNTFDKQTAKPDEYSNNKCSRETRENKILSVEYCPGCMAVDTITPHVCTDGRLKLFCSPSERKFETTGNSYTLCPVLTSIYNEANQMKEIESANAVNAFKSSSSFPLLKKNSIREQPRNKNYINDQLKNSIDTNEKNSTSSLKDPLSKKKVTSTTNQKLSLWSNPSDKNNITSLESFSLFFIINNMKTENWQCKKSDSIDLLKTVMICLRVNSHGEQICKPKAATSCPVICHCPSTNLSKSRCSCPSMRVAPNPSICYCPSVKLQSSMNEIPYCQHSQFSTALQEQKDNDCSVMVSPEQRTTSTQCLCYSVPKSKHISVQAIPSYKSSPIQHSIASTIPSTKQNRETLVCQKSACTQPSICTPETCSQDTRTETYQFLSRICSPSCKITLLKLGTGLRTNAPITALELPENVSSHPSTLEIKMGHYVTCGGVPRSSLKRAVIGSHSKSKCTSRNTISTRVHECATTQSRCCSISTSMSMLGLNCPKGLNNKKVCSFSRECKENDRTSTLKDSMTKKAIPASLKLKTAKNSNQLSHLDVSGADNFIYGENTKDLSLFTEDYRDLRLAFDKFIMMESEKNRKRKYIEKY